MCERERESGGEERRGLRGCIGMQVKVDGETKEREQSNQKG